MTTWCVKYSRKVYATHDVVVDAESEEEARRLAEEHFDDNDDCIIEGNVVDETIRLDLHPYEEWEQDIVEVIG